MILPTHQTALIETPLQGALAKPRRQLRILKLNA
jgi:hypothetical protein